jgi:Fibrillarin
VYAVEFSARSGRDLINMAKKRTNVIRASVWYSGPALEPDSRVL